MSMALHEYELNGLRYQFDDDDVPRGAKRVDGAAKQEPTSTPKTEAKARTPRNKAARAPRNKAAKPAADKTASDPAVDAATDPTASV
jgi:hypothetical protein